MNLDNTKWVVGIGETLWDCLPNGRVLGGAPANFAYTVGQFGFNSMAISAIGKDALGDEALTELDNKGLKYLMPRVNYPTGTVQVTLDEKGIPCYDIRQYVAWDSIPSTAELEDIAKETVAVCWGTLAQRNEISRTTINHFLDLMPEDSLKIFDINLRQQFYDKEIVIKSLKRCNILKINDEELVVVGDLLGLKDDICHQLIEDYQLELLVLTAGEKGSYVFRGDDMSFMPTPNVEVTDTVGAGDAFAGSFCAALLSGLSISDSHAFAVKVSAFVCTKYGAMPDLHELNSH